MHSVSILLQFFSGSWEQLMLDTYKKLMINQFQAALCTLNFCIDRCPDDLWNAKVGNMAFCQVVFHTLFYADLYLGREDGFKVQGFHKENKDIFRDYEEMEPRVQVNMYDRPSINKYMEF